MTRRTKCPRRGVTLVETAFVLGLVLLFLLGIFEYGRFLLTLQVLETATREGARFAVVRTNDPQADIEGAIRERLAGLDQKLPGFQVEISSRVLRDYEVPANDGKPLDNWDDAGINDGIVIKVTANYRPVVPAFLGMPADIPLQVQTIMYSEAN